MTNTISLIITVLNEADNIADLLDSIFRQSRVPDEVVINDNGSTDQTPQILATYAAHEPRLRVVHGGFNIPSGRNNAIRAAHGQIIAITDAGLRLDPRWLELITEPLLRGEADVVGGFFRPAPQSLFELALGATNYRDPEEIKPESFLPFGQSMALRREAWEQVGGFPEWANHCEDLVFDMALQRAGYRFQFVPDALVHFRPRESFRAFARQYYNYAKGDGVANLWFKRHILRYATYLTGSVLLGLSPRRPWLLGVLALGMLGYCWSPIRRLRRRAPGITTAEFSQAIGYMPLIRIVGDIAKMVGYPIGRWKGRQRRKI